MADAIFDGWIEPVAASEFDPRVLEWFGSGLDAGFDGAGDTERPRRTDVNPGAPPGVKSGILSARWRMADGNWKEGELRMHYIEDAFHASIFVPYFGQGFVSLDHPGIRSGIGTFTCGMAKFHLALSEDHDGVHFDVTDRRTSQRMAYGIARL